MLSMTRRKRGGVLSLPEVKRRIGVSKSMVLLVTEVVATTMAQDAQAPGAIDRFYFTGDPSLERAEMADRNGEGQSRQRRS